MQDLREIVQRSIVARKLFSRGERILVAVSGGVDSIVLLTLLAELAGERRWKLFVAHFNHQLRGRASDGDECFVSRVAEKLGLPFCAGRGAVKQLAGAQGISLEMAARRLRHEFLAQSAERLKCPVIALAHHADDQVELFFLRLLRGSGGEGLAGMKWSSPSPVNQRVRIARPLLEVGKVDLEAFARENKIRFREDGSNASPDILRNRVRHELLPLMRKRFQPALNRAVLRLMEIVGAESEMVEQLARDWLATFPRSSKWSRLALAAQRRVIQKQLQRLRVATDFDLVERLRLQPGKLVSTAAGQFVRREAHGQVTLVSAESRAFDRTERKLNLRASKRVRFAGFEVTWSFASVRRFVRPKNEANCEFFDADRVGKTVILRHWQPGDRFQPIGMKTAVKLQDWFTNQKIPAVRRRELWLAATTAGQIFWAEGLRIGEAFKLTEDTRKVLNWRWRVG